MNLLLMANNGLPHNGLVALYDMGKQIQLGNTGQTLVDFSGRGNNAQLGSAAGADTNDPTWNGGLVFGADDYCKSSSPVFDDMAQFTVITVCKANSLGGWNIGRIFDKTYSKLMVKSGNKLFYELLRATTSSQWTSDSAFVLGTPFVSALSFSKQFIDTNKPNMYINNVKSTVTVSSGGSGAVVSNAIADLLIGNSTGASTYFDGYIYLQAWYNRILSDTEYMQAYNYLKRLMSSRGITI